MTDQCANGCNISVSIQCQVTISPPAKRHSFTRFARGPMTARLQMLTRIAMLLIETSHSSLFSPLTYVSKSPVYKQFQCSIQLTFQQFIKTKTRKNKD